jgi:hypothetical protein
MTLAERKAVKEDEEYKEVSWKQNSLSSRKRITE